jgi:hypothetical protein
MLKIRHPRKSYNFLFSEKKILQRIKGMSTRKRDEKFWTKELKPLFEFSHPSEFFGEDVSWKVETPNA